MSYLYLDFEFNGVSEEDLNLVCCSVEVNDEIWEFWLHKDEKEHDKLAKFLMMYRDKTFVAYAVEAEARSMLALTMNPLNFKFIDLFLEYKCLTNHNHKLAYGRQLIDGRLKFTKPPKNKWEMTEEDKKKADMSKPQHNLAAACFKLLKVQIDTDFKTVTRDLIISSPDTFSREEKETIIKYCTSDIKYLPPMLKRVFEEYKFLLGKDYDEQRLLSDMYLRSEYAVRTAKMVSRGYPYSRIPTRNFANAVPDMLWAVQEEINELFPSILPFEKDSKRKYVFKQEKTREALRELLPAKVLKSWTKTKGKKLSLTEKRSRSSSLIGMSTPLSPSLPKYSDSYTSKGSSTDSYLATERKRKPSGIRLVGTIVFALILGFMVLSLVGLSLRLQGFYS